MATWTRPANGNKTISGCIVGKPLIIGHAAITSNDSAERSWFCIKTVSGAKTGVTRDNSCLYMIGVAWDSGYGATMDGANTFIVVPTASSVVVYIDGAFNDDEIYVYQ